MHCAEKTESGKKMKRIAEAGSLVFESTNKDCIDQSLAYIQIV